MLQGRQPGPQLLSAGHAGIFGQALAGFIRKEAHPSLQPAQAQRLQPGQLAEVAQVPVGQAVAMVVQPLVGPDLGPHLQRCERGDAADGGQHCMGRAEQRYVVAILLGPSHQLQV